MSQESESPELPLLSAPRHPIDVVTDRTSWHRTLDLLAGGTGPIAIDVERASGFRYSPRAYLVQLYRRGSHNFIVDPVEIPDLSELSRQFVDAEWILHAAHQDLPSLRNLGVSPETIFDTELGARIAGLPRVGLQGAVEDLLGLRLAKEHSAADWSTRPLPPSWIDYAALDVEILPDLRDVIAAHLEAAGKEGWAQEEFQAVLRMEPPTRGPEPWRRLSGLHQVRGQRALAIARSLWLSREELAQELDIAPGRLVPDRALIAAVLASPPTKRALADLSSFHGRYAKREMNRWWEAIEQGRQTEDLPSLKAPGDSLPPPRAWMDKNPDAARRLTIARDAIARIAASHHIPGENLLSPETLRRLSWSPPLPLTLESVSRALDDRGVRQWQRNLTAGVVLEGFLEAAALSE